MLTFKTFNNISVPPELVSSVEKFNDTVCLPSIKYCSFMTRFFGNFLRSQSFRVALCKLTFLSQFRTLQMNFLVKIIFVFTLIPYFQHRSYGGVESFPFDFIETKYSISGLRLQITAQFQLEAVERVQLFLRLNDLA